MEMKRSFLYKIVSRLIPELKILGKPIPWNQYIDFSGNCSISPKSRVNSPYNLQNVELGDYSYIDRNSFASQVKIGKYCSIGPNLMCGWGIHPTGGLSTSPMFYSVEKQNGVSLVTKNKIEERKQITIGNDVFIGLNVTIIDGVTIGHGAIIGAGSVVSKDIPPYAIAVGAPIQIIKYRFDEATIQQLLKIEWWNFPEEKVTEVEKHFFDVTGFIQQYYAS
jgi:virginiamycin A acetyltransferase